MTRLASPLGISAQCTQGPAPHHRAGVWHQAQEGTTCGPDYVRHGVSRGVGYVNNPAWTSHRRDGPGRTSSLRPTWRGAKGVRCPVRLPDSVRQCGVVLGRPLSILMTRGQAGEPGSEVVGRCCLVTQGRMCQPDA